MASSLNSAATCKVLPTHQKTKSMTVCLLKRLVESATSATLDSDYQHTAARWMEVIFHHKASTKPEPNPETTEEAPGGQLRHAGTKTGIHMRSWDTDVIVVDHLIISVVVFSARFKEFILTVQDKSWWRTNSVRSALQCRLQTSTPTAAHPPQSQMRVTLDSQHSLTSVLPSCDLTSKTDSWAKYFWNKGYEGFF